MIPSGHGQEIRGGSGSSSSRSGTTVVPIGLLLPLALLLPAPGNTAEPDNVQPGDVFTPRERPAELNAAILAEAPWLPGLPPGREPPADQCPREVALVPGRPVPPELLDADGLVACSGVLVPTATYAWHLDVADSHEALGRLYRLDVARLEAELAVRTWERDTYLLRLEAPLPWWERPQVQRWVGRLEMGAVVAVGLWAASR